MLTTDRPGVPPRRASKLRPCLQGASSQRIPSPQDREWATSRHSCLCESCGSQKGGNPATGPGHDQLGLSDKFKSSGCHGRSPGPHKRIPLASPVSHRVGVCSFLRENDDRTLRAVISSWREESAIASALARGQKMGSPVALAAFCPARTRARSCLLRPCSGRSLCLSMCTSPTLIFLVQ